MSSTLPGTPRLLRAINDRAALELLLRHGPLTRTQLGELTGLSKVTASQLMERLEARGLVVQAGEQVGGRGPNARLYEVAPDSAYVVGVEVGPAAVTAACADITGTVGAHVHQSTRDSDDPVWVVHQAVVEAARGMGAPMHRIRRIVLGSPGLVEPSSGDLTFAVDLPGWRRGLNAALRADLDVPVVFENDVNLAAVAEAHDGAARGVDDFVLVWIDRGVGLAITLGGRLHRGSTGAAGEIGYLPVPDASVPGFTTPAGGARDRPGPLPPGTFQQLAGAAALRTVARKHGYRASTAAKGVAAAVAAGPDGAPALEEMAQRLAVGVAAVCLVLDPSLVVLGGDAGRAGGPGLADRVQRAVSGYAPVSPRIAVTGVAADAVLRGAVLTALGEVRDTVFGSTTG